MDEQAPAASSLDDLAGFLADSEGADASQGLPPDDDAPGKADKRTARDTPPSDPPVEDEDDDQDPDEPQKAAGEDEDADSDDPAGQTKDQVTIKVPVVGEDGKKVIKEFTPDQLGSMVMMREDYTRKTQELSTQRTQLFETTNQRLTEGLQRYQQQGQLAMQAVAQLAGLKTDQELYALSMQDPGAYAQERARQEYVRGVLGNLHQQVGQTTQQHQAELDRQQKESRDRAFSACWGALGHDGLDGPKVKAIFDKMISVYGVEADRFDNISDPKLIRIMRDAAAYQDLKGTAQRVTAKAKTPTLPAQRQQPPKASRQVAQLNKVFASGKAGVRDLGAFLDATDNRGRGR